jgi:hypothetical protein
VGEPFQSSDVTDVRGDIRSGPPTSQAGLASWRSSASASKRLNMLTFRVSDEEMRDIRHGAQVFGMSVSDFIRDAARWVAWIRLQQAHAENNNPASDGGTDGV